MELNAWPSTVGMLVVADNLAENDQEKHGMR